jgi:methylase of polypeptide subunit release factors
MLSNAPRLDPAMTAQYNYERIENEFYPTPIKFVDCLAAHFPLSEMTWWEPCAGQGHIALTVEKITGDYVEKSDIMAYELAEGLFLDDVEIVDFLATTEAPEGVTGIITNPPYLTINVVDEPEEGEDDWRHLEPLARKYGMMGKRVSLAELFLRHAIALMKPVDGVVAMFLRNEFDCGKKRMDLFGDRHGYALKVVCTERPRWIAGSTGSPRHNYSWFVFDHASQDEPVVKYAHPKSSKPIV